MAMDKHATMEATSVFFVVCPKATIGAAVFSLWSVSLKCFLCGLFMGYITKGTIQNHPNLNVHAIGQGEAIHKKYKRVKLGGGQAYHRSSD
jgi:hypothetical protein